MDCIKRKSGFNRGGDPIDFMGIGIRTSVNEILGEGNNCVSCCTGNVNVLDGTTLVIQISEGNLVLRSLLREALAASLGIKSIVLDIIPPATSCVLDELEAGVLYSRIRETYRTIIKNKGDFDPVHVGKSRKHIEGLSDDPTVYEIRNLATDIITGDLEYAYGAKDEFGVDMGTYAHELSRRLNPV